jgi:hypothetical protein
MSFFKLTTAHCLEWANEAGIQMFLTEVRVTIQIIEIFADYKYYPNKRVYRKTIEALRNFQ